LNGIIFAMFYVSVIASFFLRKKCSNLPILLMSFLNNEIAMPFVLAMTYLFLFRKLF
jgi:hypothetical protein